MSYTHTHREREEANFTNAIIVRDSPTAMLVATFVSLNIKTNTSTFIGSGKVNE